VSDRWQRLLADFEAAAALDDEERARFLARRREEDPAAADEIARLLAADTGSGVLDSDPQRLLDEIGLPPRSTAGAGNSSTEVPRSSELDPTVGGVPPATAAAVPPVIGRYQVIERIGRGGFGDVYRAFDPVLKRAVAIKTCLAAEPEVRQRFVREAELAARLVHPNIVTVHDFGADGEVPYLVQELLPGEDLAHRLGRGDGDELSLAEQLRLLLDVAAGLATAHAAGVVHRDVKPGNLRLLPDGRVKILDFGIAREMGASSVLTGDDRAIGTLAYMAPEQARGEQPDARADVHGWGAVAYELLSGRRAFLGDSPAALIFQVLESAPPPLARVAPHCPPGLAALVDRCLDRDPSRRPADGAALYALLEPLARRLVPSDELAAPGPGPRARSRALRRRSRVATWAAAIVGVTAAVVAARLALDAIGAPERATERPARASNATPERAGTAPAPTSGASAVGADRGADLAAAPAPARPGSTSGVPSAASGAAALPAPMPTATGSTPGAPPFVSGSPPASAPAATGVLQLDARPWGELVRLVAADGHELPLPADAVTPLALVVPEGSYTAWLRHPQAPTERSCAAQVVAGGRTLCRVELRALRAADLLPEPSS